MSTLQERKKELADKRAAHALRFDAIKSAPPEAKHGLLEEINRAEVELAGLHDAVVRDQALEAQERRNSEEMKLLRLPAPTVPFSTDADNPRAAAIVSQGSPLGGAGGSRKNIGQALIESQEIKAWQESNGQRGFAIEFPVKNVREWKATLAETGLTGYERPPGVVVVGTQPPHVADLMAQGETTQPIVRYVQETSFTNAAAAVAEGGQKPEATFALAEVDAPVRKIAVIGRLTDEMLSDFPQIRDYVNERLPLMVELAEDVALLTGNGTAPNLRGLLNTSGILSGGTYNQGADTTVDPIPHPILRAMVGIQSVSYFEPDGVVMNPADWQTVRLMRTGDGGSLQGLYVYGAPSERGPLTIWGLPVVKTTAIPAKQALVGAFKLGAQIWRRQGITIDMTNADGNDFQFNRLAIRCEERIALAVYRPGAFAKVILQ